MERCPQLCENVKRRLHEEFEKRGLPGKPFVTARVTQFTERGRNLFLFWFSYKGVPNPAEVYLDLKTSHVKKSSLRGIIISPSRYWKTASIVPATNNVSRCA